MKEHFVRQINILRCLKEYPKVISTTQILESLNNLGTPASLRTVQRDLKDLSIQFGIYGDNNKPQGWSWAKDATLLLPGMDLHTALTFRLMKEFIKPLIPTACMEAAKIHFKEAGLVLGNTGQGGVRHRAWLDKIQLISRGQPLSPPVIDEQVLSVVYDALFNDLRFKATYRRRNSSLMEGCTVNPLGLVFVNKSVYLICTLWEYDDIKQMPLHRFESVELLDTPAREIENFSLKAYVENQKEFNYPVSSKDIKLVANFTTDAAYHLSETPLAQDQKIKNISDDEVEVTATVADTAQLRWWLLGFGDQVEVIRPKKLRDELVETVSNMAKRYGCGFENTASSVSQL